MTRRQGLRAADTDRERVVDQLRQAAAEGRLLAEELEERMGTALSARTYGELDAVISDLPVPSRSAQRHRCRPALPVPAVAAVAVIVLVVFAIGSAVAGHLHVAQHGFAAGPPLIWLVWVALAWRYVARRSRRAE